MRLYPLVLGLIDQRPHFAFAAERLAHADRFGAGLHCLDKRRVQGFGHQHPTGGRTHLPGIEETTQASQLHRKFQVGVLQHQQRRFAAQFQAHTLDRLRRPLHYLHTHRIAASEGNLGNTRIGRQGRAHRQPGTADQVEHPIRQPRFGDDRRQFQLGQRGDFRRLEHHAAACRQCRRQLPGGGDHGEVPRHDQTDHTARFTPYPGDKIFAGQGHRAVTPEVVRQLRVIAKGRDDIIDIDVGFNQRLAVVAGLQLYQALAARLDTLGNSPQDGRAGRPAGCRPFDKCRSGRQRCPLDRRSVATGNFGQYLLVARVDHRQRLGAMLPDACDIDTRQLDHAGTACIQVAWSISIRLGPLRSQA
ncbi:hypothetical protein D3C80_1013860 [compost metagenome]